MIWKEIEEHNGYLISNTGLIKRKEKTIIMSDNKKRHYREKIYSFKKYGYSKKHAVTIAGGKILIYENIAPLYFEKFSINGKNEINEKEVERVNNKTEIILLDEQIRIITDLRDRFRIHADTIKTLCEWEIEFYSEGLGISTEELQKVVDYKRNGK